MAQHQNAQEDAARMPLLKQSFDLTAWITLSYANEGNARHRAYCGSRIVCMVAKNAIAVFVQIVSSTTVRKAKQNELVMRRTRTNIA